jgi:inward rectifier potassium channel
MAIQTNDKLKAAEDKNTGFGTNASSYGGRLLNKDGSPNIKKTGVGFLERFSWYHSMLGMSMSKFFLIILFFYIFVNLVFTFIYLAIGVENLTGIHADSFGQKLQEAFFFSTQTFTTVGYGRISPIGFLMNAVSSLQALVGLLSFALATGLLYGRFSLPKAYIKYSKKALISPYENITGLMIRLAPFKNTAALTDVEAKVTIAMIIDNNGIKTNQFFNVKLETNKINALALSWTLVHPIDEESPLYNFKEADFANIQGEILVYLKAFDDTFSTTVVSRTSYTFDEICYGYKFLPMYNRSDTGTTTVIHVEKLNETVKVEM